MHQRIKHFLYSCSFCSVLVAHSVPTAFATGAIDVEAVKSQIISAASDVYTLIVNIIVPFMILCIARAGLELLYAAFTSRHGQAIDDIKKQAISMIFACAFLVGLPTYVAWAGELAQPHAWEPPTAQAMEGPGLEYYVEELEKYNTSENKKYDYADGRDENSSDFAGEGEIYYNTGSHKLSHFCAESEDDVSYWLHVPENATANMPVIVFLHGSGERNNIDALRNYGLINQAKSIYGEDYPFLVVYPSLKYSNWYSEDFPVTIKSMIDSVVSVCEADASRIIITGHSLGSIGTWDLVSRYGSYFSAAVPVSYQISGGVVNYTNLAKVPIWAFSGDGNDDIGYSQPMKNNVATINNNGGNAKYTLISNCGHPESKDKAYTKSTFEWMLAQ